MGGGRERVLGRGLVLLFVGELFLALVEMATQRRQRWPRRPMLLGPLSRQRPLVLGQRGGERGRGGEQSLLQELQDELAGIPLGVVIASALEPQPGVLLQQPM